MLLLRSLIAGLLAVVLTACVKEGSQNPLSTLQGRAAASATYVQLGLSYLQYAAMALVFQAEMESKLADEYFRKALSFKSDNQTRILNNYGSFLYEQGRYQEAMQRFSKAVEDTYYAGRSRVFENMGLTALKLNQPEQAIEYFVRTLRLDPKQPQALLELADLARVKREYSKALGYYQLFSEVSEQNARSLLLGIRLADQTGDRNKAKSLGLQLKRLYPASPEYQQYLSELP